MRGCRTQTYPSRFFFQVLLSFGLLTAGRLSAGIRSTRMCAGSTTNHGKNREKQRNSRDYFRRMFLNSGAGDESSEKQPKLPAASVLVSATLAILLVSLLSSRGSLGETRTAPSP